MTKLTDEMDLVPKEDKTTKQPQGILKRKRVETTSEESIDIPIEGSPAKKARRVSFFSDVNGREVESSGQKPNVNHYVSLFQQAKIAYKHNHLLECIDLIKTAVYLLREIRPLSSHSYYTSDRKLRTTHHDWVDFEKTRLTEIAFKAFEKFIASPDYIDSVIRDTTEATRLNRWLTSALFVYEELSIEKDLDEEDNELLFVYLAKLPDEVVEFLPSTPPSAS